MSRTLQEAIAEDLIEKEFYRQRDLKQAGKFAWTCSDVKNAKDKGRLITDAEKLVVLAEEFGEVSREVCDGMGTSGKGRADRARLLKELVQVATVTLGWIEAIRYHEEDA